METSPYTFIWSNGRTTVANTGLVAGTYTVTVTDATSCTATVSATITQTKCCKRLLLLLLLMCFVMVETTGSATAAGAGGTGAFTFVWSNGRTTALNTGFSYWYLYRNCKQIANGCAATTSVNHYSTKCCNGFYCYFY